jgi:uncharacterized membrane protein YeaQ/YmgE (transglycosylase-associated protein family)
MHFLIAVVVGLVIGGIGGFVLRGRHANALWLAPVLAVVGSVLASVLAAAFGDPGFGWKELTLQIILALAGVAAVAAMASRRSASTAV